MSVDGSILERLIAPLSVDALLAGWNQRPIHIPAGANAADKLAIFALDRAAFRKAAARIPTAAQGTRSDYGAPFLTALHANDRPQQNHRLLADQIEFAYDGGMTVMCTGLQVLHGPCALAAGRLRRELNHPGNVNVYSFLSPASRGARMHFDPAPAFVVQIEGTKHWRISRRPALEWPPEPAVHSALSGFRLAHPWAEVAEPDAQDMDELVLRPGHVLHLPGGTWHEATAGDHSLAINLELSSTPVHRLFARHIEQMLVPRLAWRRTPSPIVGGNPARPPVLSGQQMRFLEERLADLRALVSGLRPADLAAWAYPDLAAGPEGVPSDGPAGDDAGADSLSPDDVLEVPHVLSWTHGTDDEGIFVLLVSSAHAVASISIEAFPLVERLVDASSFRAGDCMRWSFEPDGYSWDEVRGALEGFLATGIVRRRT